MKEVQIISQSDFESLDFPLAIKDCINCRRFGILSHTGEAFRFCWQSDTINPKVLRINDLVYSLGVDLVFVILRFEPSEILLSLKLNYFFYESVIHNEFIYVVTEMEIFKIQMTNFEVHNVYPLPDLFEKIEFLKDEIIVTCVNGELIELS